MLGVSHLLYSTDYSWFFVNLLNRHYLSTYLSNMLRHWSCEKQIGARRCRCCSAVREKLVDVPVPVWVTDASDPWSIWCDSERELSPIDMAWRRRWMKLNMLSSWSKLDQCKRSQSDGDRQIKRWGNDSWRTCVTCRAATDNHQGVECQLEKDRTGCCWLNVPSRSCPVGYFHNVWFGKTRMVWLSVVKMFIHFDQWRSQEFDWGGGIRFN